MINCFCWDVNNKINQALWKFNISLLCNAFLYTIISKFLYELFEYIYNAVYIWRSWWDDKHYDSKGIFPKVSKVLPRVSFWWIDTASHFSNAGGKQCFTNWANLSPSKCPWVVLTTNSITVVWNSYKEISSSPKKLPSLQFLSYSLFLHYLPYHRGCCWSLSAWIKLMGKTNIKMKI